MLSTRSPHRYNSVGLTLAKLRGVGRGGGGGGKGEGGWEGIGGVEDVGGGKGVGGGKKKRKRKCLLLSGVDLLEGTPVFDIKPYISSYDSMRGGEGGKRERGEEGKEEEEEEGEREVRVAKWVSDESTNKVFEVEFSEGSIEGIRGMVEEGGMRFYGEKAGGLWEGEGEGVEGEVEEVKRAIRDIVRMDIRSLSQKKKGGSSLQEEEEKKQYYSFRFDEAKVEVEYIPSSCHCMVTSFSIFSQEES